MLGPLGLSIGLGDPPPPSPPLRPEEAALPSLGMRFFGLIKVSKNKLIVSTTPQKISADVEICAPRFNVSPSNGNFQK
jgi:hypothetical protein